MKNIYKIKFLLIALVVFTSCAIDNDDPVTSFASKTEFSLNSTLERTTSDIYNLSVDVAGNLPYTARLTYTLDGEEMFVDVDANSTTGIIPVDMSSSDVRIVTLTKITALYATAAGIEASISEVNNTTAIAAADVGTNGDMFVQLNWDSAEDIDLIMTTASPTAPFSPTATNVFGFGGSTTQGESFNVDGDIPAGDYSIVIAPWDTFTTPINFTLLAIVGSNVYNYSGTVNSAAVGGSGGLFSPLSYGTIVEFATCTKTGTGAASTYELEDVL